MGRGGVQIGVGVLAAGLLAVAAVARLPDDRPPDEPVPAPKPAQPAAPPPAQAPAPQEQPAPETAPAKPAPAPPKAAAPATGPAVAWPHPLITEVLYAVPTGPEGDANADGTRDVSGDEFVELCNPHDRPISLRGYAIADTAGLRPRGSSGSSGGLKFVFPAIDVPAGGVVVVFNGRNSNIPGPVGDSRQGPASGNERFGGALVLSMRQTSQRASFSNTLDSVALVAPDGALVQRVRWGRPKDGAPETPQPPAGLDETAPTVSKCGVVRDGAGPGSPWRPHLELGGVAFSPGKVPFALPMKAAEPGPDAKRPAPPARKR